VDVVREHNERKAPQKPTKKPPVKPDDKPATASGSAEPIDDGLDFPESLRRVVH
jgi:hypothetical protein